MTFFNSKPTEKTIENLKADLDELLKTEAKLWTLTDVNATRNTIPELIEDMRRLTTHLTNILKDINNIKEDVFHSLKATELSQNLRTDLEELERHLIEQLTYFKDMSDWTEENIKNVLDHNKNGNLSKTSQIIRTLIEKCEKEMGELSDNFTYIFKKFDNMITGLNAVKNNPDYILDLKEILKARIVQPDLFETWLMSGWAVLYEGNGSTKFKLIKNTKDKNVNKLLGLEDGYNEDYLEEQDYNSIQGKDVFELDAKDMILRKDLDLNQFLEHSFWRCVFDNGRDLMGRYFSAYGKDKGLYVYLISIKNDTTCQWRPLYVNNGSDSSSLDASSLLDDNGRFLSRQPKQ